MKHLQQFLLILMTTLALSVSALDDAPSGFFLPDSVDEMTLQYTTMDNLIILPVRINESITVNLILDTGCRNLVLFGKKFEKLFPVRQDRQVQFSGLGSGGPVFGSLSINNTVAIKYVLGTNIPIVIVPNKNVLRSYPHIDGVIGYEIFFRFEIEIDPHHSTITFRPASNKQSHSSFSRVPMRIEDCKPVIDSEIHFKKDNARRFALMIDTGSVLGLLVKTTDAKSWSKHFDDYFHAFGFNGPVTGIKMTSEILNMPGYSLQNVPTGVIQTPWQDHASIGMEILRNYRVVINYFKGFVCFKPVNEKSNSL